MSRLEKKRYSRIYIFLDKVKFFGLRKIYYTLRPVFVSVGENIFYLAWVILKGLSQSKNLRGHLPKYDQGYFEGKFSNYDRWAGTPILVESLILSKRINELRKIVGAIGGKRILDVGCGVGSFLHVCDKEKMQTFGLDISPWALSKARGNTVANLAKIDVEKDKFPYKDHFFDMVTAFDFVEHVRNTDLFFKEAYRVLQNGGILYIITPNGKQKADCDLTHINLKAIDDWIAKCSRFEFLIAKAYCYKWYPPFPQLFIQKVHRLISMVRGYFIEQAVIIARKK